MIVPSQYDDNLKKTNNFVSLFHKCCNTFSHVNSTLGSELFLTNFWSTFSKIIHKFLASYRYLYLQAKNCFASFLQKLLHTFGLIPQRLITKTLVFLVQRWIIDNFDPLGYIPQNNLVSNLSPYSWYYFHFIFLSST